MARGRADTGARLENFKAGLARISDEGEVIVGADELAQMAGMTRVQLVTYYINTDPAFPIIDRGGPGKPYRIDAKAALSHMIGRMEAQAEKLSSEAASRKAVIGVAGGTLMPPPAKISALALALAEMHALAERVISAAADVAQNLWQQFLSIFRRAADDVGVGAREIDAVSWSDIKQQLESVRLLERMKVEQAQYVTKAEHEGVFRSLFETVTQTILSDRSRQDPTGRWSAEESARHDDMGRNLILEIERRVMQFFEELDANDPADESADQRKH